MQRTGVLTLPLALGLGLLVSLAAAPVAAETDDAASLSVLGLTVAKADPDNKWGQSLVPGVSAGTSVYLRYRRDDLALIDVDKEACKLDRFADDKGRLLYEPGKGGTFGPSWLGRDDIADDGKGVVIEVESKQTPAKGAAALTIVGDLVLRTGRDLTVATADVPLQVEKTFTIGSQKVTVIKAGKPQWGDDPLAIQLESTGSFAAWKRVRFFGPGGKPIEASRRSSGHMRFGDRHKYTATYHLKSKPKSLSARVSYYTSVESLTVPIDLTVDLGL